MNRSISPNRVSTLGRHLLVALAGFACTLPALAGVSFPNTPLQTGSTIPPNVTLLFDDSGSMYWRYIYIHTSSGAQPTISVPKGASGAGSALTSTNTGDESSKDSFNSVTDAYGNNDCSNNGSSGTSDTASSCIATSINNSKYMVDQTYVTNGLYYNPSTTYGTWSYPNGNAVNAATYSASYQSHNYVNYSWTAVDGTTTINTTSPTVNLSTHTQTYYVPKGATDTVCTTIDTTNGNCYYRYQILGSSEFPSASLKIYRSELLQATDVGSVVSPPPTIPCALTSLSSAKNTLTQECNFAVPAGAAALTITSNSVSKAVIYERAGSAPSTTTFDNSKNSGTTITINTPAAGTYYIALYGNNAAVSGVNITATITYPTSFNITKGTTGVGCNDTNTAAGTYDWRNCVEVTPTGRSEAQEEQNFSNWYSFYETRMKTAKASISAAFSSLSTIPRAGFRDIWDRLDLDIPVATDQGLFEDKAATTTPVAAAVVNKTNWFKKVMTEVANNGTPLRIALQNMGKYYSDADTVNSHTGASGPYGPETGTNQLSCRQNFTILTTDGYWNETFSPATGVGSADDSAGFPYQSSSDSTLADVAWYYYHTDLMTGLANKVPTSTADPEAFQHMVTFTISVGAAGTLNPTTVLNYIASHTAFGGVFPSWPAPTADNVTTIDDLFHAAVNGHGSFVVASNPTAFVSALSSALSSITQRTSASSNVSTSAATLSTGTQLFAANFVTGLWTGNLLSYSINSTTGAISTSPTWQASQQLPTWSSRKFFTWNGTAGVAFPTATQQTQLGGATGANYFEGDQSNEVSNGGTFRNRTSLLGDIIDSSPIYVPADTTASTPAMLYVGGNDGMMHAFNATTGVEVFNYVPSGESFANLKTLQNTNYVHQYFVDGAIVVSTKAQTVTSSDTTGKNILVGTLGRGGGTVYALDVSDPNSFGATKVLWEYSDSDMGNSLGEPIIAKLNTADTGNGNTAVVIPNGYNGASGHSILYVLNIRTGGLIAKLDSGVGDTSTNSNGMSTARGWDADHSGSVDLLYAGDYLGNMWEFDISDSNAANWKSVFPASGAAQPFYTAKDASGTAQPITSAPAIGLNPADFSRWVFFGTGAYISNGDPTNKNVQTWYGLIDAGSKITSVTTRNSTTLKQRKILIATTSNGSNVRGFQQPVAGDMSGKKGWYLDLEDYSTATPTATGERMISDEILINTILLAASVIPSADACDLGGTGYVNAIDAFTGGAATNPFFDINGDGLFNGSDKLTSGGTTVSIGSLDLGVGMGTLPGFIGSSGLIASGSGGTGVVVQSGTNGNNNKLVNNPSNFGRVSWREVLMGN
ncbi:MAG TPA: PilC/PilY family type IV pilus protein [Xanthomonadaceae bacterium]|jgi:type IV pilus assembly protein PilY1